LRFIVPLNGIARYLWKFPFLSHVMSLSPVVIESVQGMTTAARLCFIHPPVRQRRLWRTKKKALKERKLCNLFPVSLSIVFGLSKMYA
jgi:hypothetical protein